MKKSKQKIGNILTPNDLQAIGDVVYGIVDKQVATLATKKDLEGVKKELSDVRADMATKKDLSDLEGRLNTRMDEGFESVIDGVDAVANKLAGKEQFEDLKKWAYKTGYKAALKLK